MTTAKVHVRRRIRFLDRRQAGAGDIVAPDGKVMEKAGAVRDGGSFEAHGQGRLLELGDGRGTATW
jgi:putative spermidine/putrescine transport system substrate-binding protein